MGNNKDVIDMQANEIDDFHGYEITPDIGNIQASITGVDDKVNQVLSHLGLPTENVVVEVRERIKIFKNLEDIMNDIQVDKSSMLYLSKFIHAVTDGLFDAALNYLWDALIHELRTRVINYDVEYFYDLVESESSKRDKLSGENDLVKIQDSVLLKGINNMELIDNVAYKELEHILFMRNWTSTAHPNEEELTGYKLLAWLEICINKVFNLPLSEINIEVRKFLSDIKKRRFDNDEISYKKEFLKKLNSQHLNALLKGLFGIYTSEDSQQDTIDNINLIAPDLWALNDSTTKKNIGIKFGNFKINGHKEKEEKAQNFLDIVSGQEYIPEDLKIVEISNRLSELDNANNNNNNFYTEPPIVNGLYTYTKNQKIPSGIETEYVITIVRCFLTNGYGVAWNAETCYIKMIEAFTNEQALIALFSYLNEDINNRLQLDLCSKQFDKLLTMLKVKITTPKAIELIDFIAKFNGEPKIKFINDVNYKRNFSKFIDTYAKELIDLK
ncbi:hypothetical protein [Listeria booriae]|uniref:hypothetical protein n=1 Tax=Listeria booriae TaxID=1552123 RepID=UPI001C8A13ED|nr:hypothetical protein [Listeria booriae]